MSNDYISPKQQVSMMLDTLTLWDKTDEQIAAWGYVEGNPEQTIINIQIGTNIRQTQIVLRSLVINQMKK